MRGRVGAYIRHNAIGCVALFFALSGGAAWATHPGGANTIGSGDIIDGEVRKGDIGLNAVGTDKINNGAVRSVDILDDTVQGVDVRDDSLSGADVEESGLGQVPSAAQANDAQTVDGFSAGCPTGTRLYLGACWETERRPAADTQGNAMTTCGNDGRILPHALESREFAFDFRGFSDADVLEWTQTRFSPDVPTDSRGIAISRNGGTSYQDYQAVHPFRCVAPLVR